MAVLSSGAAHDQPPRAELLSPAGDWDALRAAVANGADAVYFGLEQFNARHRAQNFTRAELRRVIDYLHERGVRGYVTFNTLIFSTELPEAAALLAEIARAGADAVIVQDLGLARLARRLAPGLAVHGSTQMTLTESRGIERVRELGIERVILARELTLDEIRQTAAATTVPVEVFVHGALCVAYSGQCLTSEALGARSANRGQCAQACRLPYQLVVDGAPRDLGDLAYLLSPQDLAAHDLIEPLVASGVVSLKIEGRLKSAQYVAAATGTYRSALDAALERRDFAAAPEQLQDLAQSFSRGFTPGFLRGVNHQQLVAGRFPKSRGLFVGRVAETTRNGVQIELDPAGPAAIKPGDGLVFDEGHPEQDEQGGRVYAVEPVDEPAPRPARQARGGPAATPPGSSAGRHPRVEVRFGRGQVNLAAITPGALVWKTDDPAVRRRLEKTFAHDKPPTPQVLALRLTGQPGEALVLSAQSSGGPAATSTWPGPLALAQKHPTSEALVREQLGRLGGTPFTLGELELAVDPRVMIPKSVLNDLRRQVVAALTAEDPPPPPGQVVHEAALAELRAEGCLRRPPALPGPAPDAVRPSLVVLARNVEQVAAVCAWQASQPGPPLAALYCDFEDVRRYRLAVEQARAIGLPVILATLRIIKPADLGWLAPLAKAEPDGVLVRNLGALDYFRREHPELPVLGDYTLNVANELAADWLWDQGLGLLVPSYDLNWSQLASLLAERDPAGFELVIHQHLPMFHMEHCVFAHTLSDGKDWRDCGRPCDRHRVELRDRVGSDLPLVADAGCRNTVFNAVAQSAAEYVPRMLALGARRFRVELLREEPAAVAPLLARYRRLLDGEEAAVGVWRQLQVLSQLGVTRGTFDGE